MTEQDRLYAKLKEDEAFVQLEKELRLISRLKNKTKFSYLALQQLESSLRNALGEKFAEASANQFVEEILSISRSSKETN